MAGMTAEELFAGAADGFVVVPEDTYSVSVKKAEYKPSKNGKPQVTVTFAITDGPHAGKTVRSWLTYTPASESDVALGILKRNLVALLGEGFLSAGGVSTPAVLMERVAASLPGKVCRVKVAIEPYNEEDRNTVKAILPASAQQQGQVAAADPFATAPQAPVAAPVAGQDSAPVAQAPAPQEPAQAAAPAPTGGQPLPF